MTFWHDCRPDPGAGRGTDCHSPADDGGDWRAARREFHAAAGGAGAALAAGYFRPCAVSWPPVAGRACCISDASAVGPHHGVFRSGMPGAGGDGHCWRGAGRGCRLIALVHSARILLVVMTLPFLVQWLEGVQLGARRATGLSIVDTPIIADLWLVACGVFGVMLVRPCACRRSSARRPMLASAAVHVPDCPYFSPASDWWRRRSWCWALTIGCRFRGHRATVDPADPCALAGSTVILLALTVAFAAAVSRVSSYGIVPLMLAFSPGGWRR